jgi:glycogen debranching enzyme
MVDFTPTLPGQRHDHLLQAASQQLYANLYQGQTNGVSYSYTVPSNGTYPYAWFWDSCLHAISWSHINVDIAKDEIRTLLRGQRRNGRIPQRVVWKKQRIYEHSFYLHSTSIRNPGVSKLIQPPVIAQAIEAVYRRSRDRLFLEQTLPRADRFYRWLAEARDPDADGLVSIIHPYESGLDHKPSFDVVLGVPRTFPPAATVAVRLLDVWNRALGYNLERLFRLDRFNVEETLFNCVYAEGLSSLARLWREIGATGKAEDAAGRAHKTTSAILGKMRASDGRFYDLYSRKERKAQVNTITCLLPLLLDGLPSDEAGRLVRQLTDERQFWLPYPVPSVSADDPAFEPEFRTVKRSGLWRGPTWISGNWFVVRGLLKHGFRDEARHITEQTRRLTEAHGFREFHNPYTGQPGGAEGFAWSTLVIDMLAAVAEG